MRSNSQEKERTKEENVFGSMLLFGTNDMVVLRSEGIEQIQRFDILWRYFAAFGAQCP